MPTTSHLLRGRTRPTVAILTVAGAAALSLAPASLPTAAGAAAPTCFERTATLTDADARGGVLRGTPGDDVIAVRNPNIAVFAGEGKDRVCGSAWVHGGPERDLILLGRWSEQQPELHGGAGDDRIILDNGMTAFLRGGEGDDELLATAGRQFLLGGPGNDALGGGKGDDDLQGGDGADSLYGYEGDDTLRGADGTDHLRGMAGQDVVVGGAGDDFVLGGPGADRLYGQRGTDSGLGGDGIDTCGASTETRRSCERLDADS